MCEKGGKLVSIQVRKANSIIKNKNPKDVVEKRHKSFGGSLINHCNNTLQL